jgi:hypothetical protein
MARKITPIWDFFEARYYPEPMSGCWLWLGDKTKAGYGARTLGAGRTRRRFYAHRLSYELHKGSIPAGTLVCHQCDTPACVNPDHLFLGTRLDNTTDRDRKGRVRHGETHPIAKLTLSQVRIIRADKIRSGRQWALLLGVSRSAITAMRRGETWRRAH